MRLFVAHLPKPQQLFGDPPFAVEKARLSGVLVERDAEGFTLDDSTGVLRVLCATPDLRAKVAVLPLGSQLNVLGAVSTTDGSFNVEAVVRSDGVLAVFLNRLQWLTHTRADALAGESIGWNV